MPAWELDAELTERVHRAREGACERGELLTGPSGIPTPPLSERARQAIAEWVKSGDYDRIVAEITANDPDIATQR